MKFKKMAAVATVGVAGAALVISTQGSAQAAQAKPVPAPAVSSESANSPMVIGTIARAVGQGLKTTADNMLLHGTVIGVSSKAPSGVSVDTAFDK
ncbi:hypothetical protein ACFWIY_23785 [Streptomyces sioyaensis]|uniref:hypothetical protein n=1 Tax=Streptomyces sioyaensis TaxID=67364 RepID=UPI00365C3C4F